LATGGAGVNVHQPKNTKPAEKYWVFLSVDPDGMEGVIAIPSEFGLMPLTTCDEGNLPKMREVAKGLRKLTGKKIVIGVFERRGTDEL
jgi:hypothetical protein